MVMPTILWPWRTSSAATVELSTPPLMATAMGAGSGMYGYSSQMGYRRFERLQQGIHLFSRGSAAEGKTQAGAGAVRRKSQGGEHVGWRDGARRAGRARRHHESPQVESDHHGFSIHSIEINIAGIGRPIGVPATDAGAGDTAENTALQPVAQRRQTLGFRGQRSPGEFASGAEGHDTGHIFGPRPAVALVMSAECGGRELGSLAHVECAHALGSVELVAAHAVKIDAERFHVDRDFPERLHAIHVQSAER